ncbi:hypothetical protein [Jeongeupia chitinilytica]|uniref:Helix-turn-helix domain-containing protein n=1 Tax=Jeongeupia chitinilytica TaxID=1041641 RepID=A0ABQ3GXT8_9NEIS|nr:hypothetical protein [Jeongeupia chitinilytica]GHD60326.1 hypothetical protein GCM10007350_13190 [Jeongeupia chitinilytica]
MSVLISDAERAALEYLDPFDFKLYVLGLRWHMDYQSGIVGRARGISYQSLSEAVESHPEACSRAKAVKPTEKRLRCALERFERLGLVVRKHDPKHLVFSLPLATLADVRPKSGGQMKGRDEGRAASRASAGVPTSEGQTRIAHERHTSEVGFLLSESSSSVESTTGADGAVADEMMPVEEGNETLTALATVLRDSGIPVSPRHAQLRSWASAAVSVDELRSAVATARKYKPTPEALPLAYLAKVLQTARSSNVVPLTSAGPAGKPWFESWSGIQAKGEAFGLFERDFAQPQLFREAVLQAAGVGRQAQRVAHVDAGGR